MKSPLDVLKARIADLDPKAVDEMYGLEPVYEPGEGGSALSEFAELQCPWCGEVYGAHVDLTDRSRVYIEDCQVCCQPIEVTLEIGERGELRQATTARVE